MPVKSFNKLMKTLLLNRSVYYISVYILYKQVLGFILFIMLIIPLAAQPSNDSIYTRLISSFVQTDSIIVKAVKGAPISHLLPKIPIDSSSKVLFVIGEPQITYKKISNKRYTRELSLMFQLQDSTVDRNRRQYRDTLDKASLKSILRNSSPELVGNSPTPWNKWIRPVVLISSGVGVIFALFYLRSGD